MTAEASTQIEMSSTTIPRVDASTMTEEVDDATPFRIEQFKGDPKLVEFYTGFPSFQI